MAENLNNQIGEDGNHTISNLDRGMYPKYRVVKIPQEENADQFYSPNAPLKNQEIPLEELRVPFFVMKFDDPHARKALEAYATSVQQKYPKLAADIHAKLDDTKVDD